MTVLNATNARRRRGGRVARERRNRLRAKANETNSEFHLPTGLLDHEEESHYYLPTGLLDDEEEAHYYLPTGLLDDEEESHFCLPDGLLEHEELYISQKLHMTEFRASAPVFIPESLRPRTFIPRADALEFVPYFTQQNYDEYHD